MKLFIITAVAGLLFASSSLLNIANAGLMTVELDKTYSNDVIHYSETVDTTYDVTSDAIFTLSLWGDFYSPGENLEVKLEDLKLGIVLNNKPWDDYFDFDFFWHRGKDDGADYKTITGTATIAQADWEDVVSDGFVNLNLNASNGCSWCNDVLNYKAWGNISYSVEDPTPTNVPEPATLAIFGLALLGFTVRRAKK